MKHSVAIPDTSLDIVRDAHGIEPPRLPAMNLRAERGKPVHTVTWCPWCEAVHSHGAAGGDGGRAPHCGQDRHSPFLKTGYALDIVGEAYSENAIIPGGLMVGQRRLHQVLDQASLSLRAIALRFILNVKSARSSVIQARNPNGKAWIFGTESWLIEVRGRKPVEGTGFLRLASTLYGVSPGIAAVRFLEAVTLDRLDAEAAFAVQRVVDEWVARGARSRAGR